MAALTQYQQQHLRQHGRTAACAKSAAQASGVGIGKHRGCWRIWRAVSRGAPVRDASTSRQHQRSRHQRRRKAAWHGGGHQPASLSISRKHRRGGGARHLPANSSLCALQRHQAASHGENKQRKWRKISISVWHGKRQRQPDGGRTMSQQSAAAARRANDIFSAASPVLASRLAAWRYAARRRVGIIAAAAHHNARRHQRGAYLLAAALARRTAARGIRLVCLSWRKERRFVYLHIEQYRWRQRRAVVAK